MLPAALPNLLLNGSAGIAVAIATKIPPHNMLEVVAALKALMQNPAISTVELMKHIPAPDFPTGARTQCASVTWEMVGSDSGSHSFPH